jgi:hypothetical protein
MAEDYSKSLEAIFERIRSLFDHLGLWNYDFKGLKIHFEILIFNHFWEVEK